MLDVLEVENDKEWYRRKLALYPGNKRWGKKA